MAGVLLKNHYEPTGARAILANRRGEGFRAKAYGAAVLNWPLGGLNPYAVHSALKMGAHVIFMPTRDAANCLFHGDMPGDFFRGRASAYWISGESAPGNLRDLRSGPELSGPVGYRPYQPLGIRPALPGGPPDGGKDGFDSPGVGPYHHGRRHPG